MNDYYSLMIISTMKNLLTLLLIFISVCLSGQVSCDLTVSPSIPDIIVPYSASPVSCTDRDVWRIDVRVDSFSTSNGPLTFRLTNDSITELIENTITTEIVDSLVEGPGDFDETNMDGIFEGLTDSAEYRLFVSDMNNCTLEYRNVVTFLFLNISAGSDFSFTCDGSTSRAKDIADPDIYDTPPGLRAYYREEGNNLSFIGYFRGVTGYESDVCPDFVNDDNVDLIVSDQLENINNLCCDPVELDINNNPIPRRVVRSYTARNNIYGNLTSVVTKTITIEGENCPPAIPTVSQWGLIVLALLMLIMGIAVGNNWFFQKRIFG
jgi:hypothetical protein